MTRIDRPCLLLRLFILGIPLWWVLGLDFIVPHGLAALLLWHGARAKVLAARGEFVEAERLGREGVRIAAGSDLLPLCAAMHHDLAVILEASGNPRAAVEEMGRALQLFERKGADVAASRTREELDRLRRRSSTRAPGGAA